MKDYLNFTDISAWQAGLDLKKLFELNPLDGVIVKATGGTSHVQPTCDPWVQTLIGLGRPWGFYHFLNDDGVGASGAEEARFFVENCANYFGEGMPFADYEAQAGVFGTGYLLEFLETVRELTGVRCGVYCNLSTLQSQDFTLIAQEGYPLWLAQYKDFSPSDFSTVPWQSGSVEPFPRFVMHQYSSCGRLEGFGGALDLDRFYGSAGDWQELLTPGTAKSAETTNGESGEPRAKPLTFYITVNIYPEKEA